MPQPTPKEPVQDDGATKDVASLEPAASVKRNPKFCFDDTLISIQIEDTLFNIHKYQLMESTTFSDMFAVAEESNDPRKNREGLSLDHPIVMLGVSASDFECLMTVLYARQFCTNLLTPKASLIIPAFRLANMWDFTDLCASLMPLAEKELGDVDKILFAREFKIEGWLVPAYMRLCQRNEPLTTEEAHKLGVDALLFIYQIREDLRLTLSGWGQPSCFCNHGLLTCGTCNGTLIVVRSPRLDAGAIQGKVETWLEHGHTI
ncbi:hypothetical protein FRC08_006643 [Ceratobasidium sp. 394]|nr:hypothetical protein FRC08_006643 [Ceratobasidium sp. 394]